MLITPSWKQSKCPSRGEWIHRSVHVYTGILLSNKKEQTISTNNNTGESQKHTGQKKPAGERDYSVQLHVCKILENTNQLIRTESRSVVAWGWVEGERGSGHKESFGGDSENRLMDVCVCLSKVIKLHSLNTYKLVCFNNSSILL